MKTAFKIFTAALALFLLGRLIIAARKPSWDEATMWTALLVGLVAAVVVIWQGYLIKQQIAFSTYLDLDKEWNSAEMIEARQRTHELGSKNWDHSRLEVILNSLRSLHRCTSFQATWPSSTRARLASTPPATLSLHTKTAKLTNFVNS